MNISVSKVLSGTSKTSPKLFTLTKDSTTNFKLFENFNLRERERERERGREQTTLETIRYLNKTLSLSKGSTTNFKLFENFNMRGREGERERRKEKKISFLSFRFFRKEKKRIFLI